MRLPTYACRGKLRITLTTIHSSKCIMYLCVVVKLKDDDTVAALLQYTYMFVPEVFMGINFHKIVLLCEKSEN